MSIQILKENYHTTKFGFLKTGALSACTVTLTGLSRDSSVSQNDPDASSCSTLITLVSVCKRERK